MTTSNDKPWLASYPEGVAAEIDVNTYSSINALVYESFLKFHDHPAFICMGTTLTYGELDVQSRRFANFLREDLKLEKGDRVAIMLPNVLQYPIAMLGILRAGMVVVNTNPMYTGRELKHQLIDSGAKAIVVLDNFVHTVAEVIDDTECKTVLTTGLGDFLNFPKSVLVNFVIKHVKRLVPAFGLATSRSFKTALAQASDAALPKIDVTHDDIAFLQYTGGTTGVAKGAMLTHRNMVANVLQSSMWLTRGFSSDREIIIAALPLYHIFALTANCLTFMRIGGANVLIPNPRDMEGFVAELRKYPFTGLPGVNTLFNGLLNTPGFAELDFSHLKLSLGGGMAVQRAVAERWKEVTGCVLAEAYGLTETSPAACMNPLDNKVFNGSIGLPISSTEGSIQDDDGVHLAIGEVGELCIRGPQVMKGYWNRPDETEKVMTKDGWLRTGDIARMDENGYFYIVDRKKDMILVSGFNVYPNEIEDVVTRYCPGVLEVAAVGVPDEKSGEVVKLVIVRKDPALTEEDIRACCKHELTGYKQPKIIEFRDALPKTNVGKILRRELRDAHVPATSSHGKAVAEN
ncbi:MAG: AMP-binding protein [Dokdonella sp.]